MTTGQMITKMHGMKASQLIAAGNALSAKHLNKAIAAYEMAAQRDPGTAATVYFDEAVAYFNHSLPDKTIAAATRCLQLNPKLADAWYFKGMSLLSKTTTDSATGTITYASGTAEAFQAYLKLKPSGRYAPTVKSILSAMRPAGK